MGHIALQDYLRQIEGLLDDNRLEEAAAHCYSILQQQPRHVATYRLFGRVLLEQQEFRQAIDIFQRVLSADPEDLFAHAGLAEAYRATGDLPRSIWYMERAFEIQPYNRAVQLELRELYEQRDGFAPEQVSLTRAALARLYVLGGHYRLAAEELQALLIDQPDRIDLRVLLAEALFWDDRRLEAAQVCADIKDELSDCIKANAILAEVWLSGGRESEARPFFERLWALTLLVALDRNTETLVGRVFNHTESAVLPEQILVERLDYVPASIQEPVESPVPRSEFPAVAVQELPGWMEELDEESVPLTEGGADRPIEEEEEPDWSHQSVAEGEMVEWLESAAPADTAELENIESDLTEGHLEETLSPETVEGGNIPDIAESIDAETALLLESDADGDAKLQSTAGVSGVLGSEDADEDGPIEPAETLVGEHKVAQEEMPAGELEESKRAFLSEEVSSENSEEEDIRQWSGDPVVEDDGPPQRSADVEPDYSPEDLFLESIVAEAFGEMEPIEAPEGEPAELVWDEEDTSALEPQYRQDDISLEEIAAEAFEEEIAAEVAEDLAQESAPEPPKAVAPERTTPLDVPFFEQTAPKAFDEPEPRLPDEEDGPSTDLLFAALAARKMEDHLPDEQQESTFAGEDEEIERRSQADAFGQDLERSAEQPGEWPELAPESTVASEYEDWQRVDDFETLAQEAPASSTAAPQPDEAASQSSVTAGEREDEAELWPQDDGVEAESAELADEAEFLNPADIVTKEFDGLPAAAEHPAEPVAGEAASAPEGLAATGPEPQMPEAMSEEAGTAHEETPLFESPASDVAAASSDIDFPAAIPSDDLVDMGEARDIGDPSDWLDDLSEDTTDIENLPDWLYDAIGFTGELEMPDDYEEPKWLGKLGGEMEESVRESQPMASAETAQKQSDEAQEAAHEEADTPTVSGTSSDGDQAIPDWLQDAGGSLEELPTDLVENLGISESDVGDEDEGALSWLEEFAAEPASTDIENGARNADVFDRSAKKPPGDPGEQTDSD